MTEPIPDPGCPADLLRPFHVYIRVDPVQPEGLRNGAAGVLHRGDSLDPHSGPHAESRAGSVLSHRLPPHLLQSKEHYEYMYNSKHLNPVSFQTLTIHLAILFNLRFE